MVQHALRCLFAIPLFVATTVHAHEAEEIQSTRRPYVSVKIGHESPVEKYDEENYGQSQWGFDDGYRLSLATGVVMDNIRMEVELSRTKLDGGISALADGSAADLSGNQTLTSIFLAGYWQPRIDDRIYGLLGAGIGYTRINWNDVRANEHDFHVDDSDGVISYKFGIGAGYKLTSSLDVEATYHLIKHGNFEVTDDSGDTGQLSNVDHHVFNLGVKYNF